jgi:hypothetical protein
MLLSHLSDLEADLLAAARALPPDAPDPATRRTALTDALVQRWFDPMFGGELLPERHGELADSRSGPDTPRPAFDLLLCQRDAPRLRRSGAATICLVETVVATLAVVPLLDLEALQDAARAAHAAKQLQRLAVRAIGDGAVRDDQPPGGVAGLPALPCHLLAFDGPRMETVHAWLKQAYRAEGIVEADLPMTGSERCQVASPALDGVFVLGRGFLNFDNMPWAFIDDLARMTAFGAAWVIAEGGRGSLASLTLQLQLAATAMAGLRLDPRPYTTTLAMPGLRIGN